MLLKRLQQVVGMIYSELQCGFRPQRSTEDMIFTVRQLQEKACEQRQPPYLAFFDLIKAFDLVDRKSLFTVLTKSGCLLILQALIRSFHEDVNVKVQFDGGLSESFPNRKE